MRDQIVKGTSVAYHSDYFGPARPAINVKIPWSGYGSQEEAIRDRLTANPAIGEDRTEELFRTAEEIILREAWSDAEQEAERLGLGPIEQEGRSGGWLVFSDGRDPQEFGGAKRIAWLAAYRAMVAFCEDYIRAIPLEIAELAEQMALGEAVAP